MFHLTPVMKFLVLCGMVELGGLRMIFSVVKRDAERRHLSVYLNFGHNQTGDDGTLDTRSNSRLSLLGDLSECRENDDYYYRSD